MKNIVKWKILYSSLQIWQKCNTLAKFFFFLFLQKSRQIFACSRENRLIDYQYISLKFKITECFFITEHFYLQHLQ